MIKRFRISASDIQPLANGKGSCIASDHITVEGKRVGFMYREKPTNATDSGWRFFSGEESQTYADTAGSFAIYDVNTIANYDPSIIPLLSAPIGNAFGRGESGQFKAEDAPGGPDG